MDAYSEVDWSDSLFWEFGIMTEFAGGQSVRVDPLNRGDVSGNWGVAIFCHNQGEAGF